MIYLDNAATSHPKSDVVIEAVSRYIREIGASPGRSSHQAARSADEVVFKVRQALARLFGISLSERIVFTANATEAGTLNGPGLAGLGASVQYIIEEGIESIRERETALVHRLESGLGKIESIRLRSRIGSCERIAFTSITVDGMESQQMACELDRRFGVCVRAGLHCAPDAHKSIGTFPGGTIRFSPGPFTTEAEIDTTIEAVGEIAT